MGLNGVLEVGRNGLSIYQIATEVTGENIANVNTPGYSRQRIILENAPPTTANGFPLGTGVKIASVERVYDKLLQQQLVNSQSTQGYDTAKSSVLQQIEPIFNEVANDGLGASIENFFGAWQDLALNPSGTAERQAVLGRAQIMVDNFHSASTSLSSAQTTQNNAIKPLADDINAILNNIAQLNGQIKNTELVSGNANEMRDQRDQLVRDLSQKMGISYKENTDGTTDVYVTDNSANPLPVDYYLVKGNVAGSVNADDKTNPTKTVVTVTDAITGVTSNALDPTAAIPFYKNDTDGGQLWSTLKLRDVTIPGYQAKVDELANQVATQVNSLHAGAAGPPQTGGADLNGNPGVNFFDFNPALGAPPANAARNIFVNVTTTDQIAATTAPTPPAVFASGDNTNALAIAQLLNKQIAFSSGSATFGSYFNTLVSNIGLDVQSAKTTVAQDDAFAKQLTTLRESNSGVSLDEELTNLVKYQRSYQASAKLITTATDMMDTIIGMVR